MALRRKQPQGVTLRLYPERIAPGSERIIDGLAAFVVARGHSGRCRAGADRFAVFVEALRKIPFDPVVDDPVVASVGINPDTRDQLAQVGTTGAIALAVVTGFVGLNLATTAFAGDGRNDSPAFRTGGECKRCTGEKRGRFEKFHNEPLLPDTNNFDAAILCHA